MYYQLAIVERPTADEQAAGGNEKIIYGPVNVLTYVCDESALAARVAAEAAAAGKLPNGWTDRMYVAGTHMRNIG